MHRDTLAKRTKNLKKYTINRCQENCVILNSSQLSIPQFLTLNKFEQRHVRHFNFRSVFPVSLPPQLPQCTTKDECNVTWAEIYPWFNLASYCWHLILFLQRRYLVLCQKMAIHDLLLLHLYNSFQLCCLQ